VELHNGGGYSVTQGSHIYLQMRLVIN